MSLFFLKPLILLIISNISLLHVQLAFSNFLEKSTELEIAISLTLDAKEEHVNKIGSTALICETWLFARWNTDGTNRGARENQLLLADSTTPEPDVGTASSETSARGKWPPNKQQLTDIFSETYSKTNYEQLQPMVLLEFDGSERLATNFSYDSEFTDEDIMEPLRFGFRRRSPNCISVFINVPTEQIGNEITNSLLATKSARPHKEYFIYIGTPTPITSLLSTEKFKDMRYKFGFMLMANTNDAKQNIWWNTCERQNERLELFSRKCDSLISNRNFLISACNIPTLVSYEHNEDGSLKWGEGTIYSMFVEAGKRNNFTFSIRYAHFNGASGFKKDGKWYGAVGEVFSREADIACAVAPTVYRHVINDPSITQVYMVRVFFILRPPYQTSWQSIYWPLTSGVWLLTVCTTVFLVTPVFYASAVSYMMSLKNTKHDHLLGEVIDALYRILMEQAATWRHWTGNRIRILILMWTFFCLILRTSYSSKLIVFLSFLQQEEIPTTHRELSLSTTYQMYFRYYGGVAWHVTTISNDPMHKRIRRRAILVNSSDECMIISLNNPLAACLDYRISGEYAINKKLVLTPHENTPLFVGSKDTDVKIHIIWSYRKGSPWIESFDKPLLNMLAAGLYDIWKQRMWYNAKKEGSTWVKNNTAIKNKLLKVKEGLAVGPKPLNLDSLYGVFMIMNVGIIAGVIFAAGEFFKYFLDKYLIKYRKAKETNRIHDVDVTPTPHETLEDL